jgi:hypothetical protein
MDIVAMNAEINPDWHCSSVITASNYTKQINITEGGTRLIIVANNAVTKVIAGAAKSV